jgi:hypothetical protein
MSAIIIGIIVSAFFLIAFGPKIIGLINENGLDAIKQLGGELIDWYDTPTGFFVTYFVGYIVIWRNKLFGALIILLACLLVTLINIDNFAWIIFTFPAAVVGILYLIYWNNIKGLKNNA